jgi:valyl-tRNA synthetase
LADSWILARYAAKAQEVHRHLERYDFGEAARALYDFIWTELCDWYIEMVKPRLYGHQGAESRQVAQSVLWYVLVHTLELLHPFMPFVTEEIWQHLPHTGESIMVAPWPTPGNELIDQVAVEQMSVVMEVIRAIRNIRSEKAVPPDRTIRAIAHADSEKQGILGQNRSYVITLARLSEFDLADTDAPKPEKALAAVAAGVELFLPLAGLIDIDAEVARLTKELAETEEHVSRTAERLRNPGFVDRAPAQVVEGARQQLRSLEEKRDKLAGRLRELA